MKVIYEFTEPEDKDERHLFEISSDMYDALFELDNIRRNLYKGYKYFKEENTQASEEEEKYSKIDVDLLIDDISDIVCNSRIDEIR